MNSRTWKKEEQRIAEDLCTSRALGTDGKNDAIHNLFLVDSKLRQNWSVHQWFKDLKKEADKKGKIPVLELRQPRKHQRVAMLEWHVFVSLVKAADWGPKSEPETVFSEIHELKESDKK